MGASLLPEGSARPLYGPYVPVCGHVRVQRYVRGTGHVDRGRCPEDHPFYWPNKMADDGTSANLQAALMDAGKTEGEARRRTTCEVFSQDPLAVRGYTLFGGQPILIPVAIY